MPENNREIKFRGWGRGVMFNVDVLALTGCTWSCPDNGKIGVSQVYQSHIKLMQFTGLQDIDGVDIYEGDIVSIPTLYETPEMTDTKYQNWLVLFHKGAWRLVDKIGDTFGGDDTTMHEEHFSYSGNFKIVGNIYENPSLLTP